MDSGSEKKSFLFPFLLIVFFIVGGMGAFFWVMMNPPASKKGKEMASPQVAKLNRRGIESFQKGRYKEALALFRRAYEKAPQSSKIAVNIARAHLALEEEKEALTYLDQALKNGSGSPTLRLLKGQVLKSLLRLEEAEKIVSAIVKDAPEFSPARLELVGLQILQANSKGALKTLKESREILEKKGAEEYHYFAGRAHFELGQWKEAARHFNALPTEPYALEWRAKLALYQKEIERGLEVLKKGVQNSSWPLSKRWKLKIEIAKLERARGNFQGAREIYEDIERDMAKEGKSPLHLTNQIRGRMIMLKMAQGQWKTARKEWAKFAEEARGVMKKKARLWLWIAAVLEGGKPEVKLPGDPPKKLQFLELWTTLQLLRGRSEKEVAGLPYLGRRYKNNALFFQGLFHWHRGEKEKAKKLWKRGLEVAPPGDFPHHILRRIQ